MITFKYVIRDPVGLHARPAGKLVEITKKLDSKVEITYGNRVVDATKLIRIISLGIVTGAEIQISIVGGNEAVSYTLLREFFEQQV